MFYINRCFKKETLLKKRLWHSCFPVNFAKFKNTFFTEHFRETASGLLNYNNRISGNKSAKKKEMVIPKTCCRNVNNYVVNIREHAKIR